MQLSAMTFSYAPGSLDAICHDIAQQGFHLIDLAVGSKHQVDLLSAAMYPKDEAAWVRKVLATYHLEVSEVFLLRFTPPMIRRRMDQHNIHQEFFNKFVEFCYEIGAKSIMMSPGKMDDELGEQASRQLALDELRFQVDACAAKGLELNIEPHWHSLAESPETAQWFCEQIPGLGLTLDYSHFIAQGYSQDEIEPLHTRTRHMHARQAKKDATNATYPEGTIDFHRIMQKLKKDAWDGVICLEYNPALIEDAPGEIERLAQELATYLPEPNNYMQSPPESAKTTWSRIVFDPQWCRTCKLCEMVCSIYHEGEANPALARINIAFNVMQVTDPIKGTVCSQCPDAPCLLACPVGAMSRNEKTGAVVIDPELCIGCMACRRACPWDVPKRYPNQRIAFKCDLCGDREGGPLCVERCPLSGKALRYVQTQEENIIGIKVIA